MLPEMRRGRRKTKDLHDNDTVGRRREKAEVRWGWRFDRRLAPIHFVLLSHVICRCKIPIQFS